MLLKIALAAIWTMIFAACSSLGPASVHPTCPNCVTKTLQDPAGLLTLTAPDVDGFESLGMREQKVFVECEFTVLEKHNDKLNPEADASESKFSREECGKLAGRLMLQKKFILMPEASENAERWLFRFEETRGKEDGDRWTRTWATLTRFAGRKEVPLAHALVEGQARYERRKIGTPPADSLTFLPAEVAGSRLTEPLMKALILGAAR